VPRPVNRLPAAAAVKRRDARRVILVLTVSADAIEVSPGGADRARGTPPGSHVYSVY